MASPFAGPPRPAPYHDTTDDESSRISLGASETDLDLGYVSDNAPPELGKAVPPRRFPTAAGAPPDDEASSVLACFALVQFTVVVIAKTLLTKLLFTSSKTAAFGFPASYSVLSAAVTMCALLPLYATGISTFEGLPKKHYRAFGVIAFLTAVDMGAANSSLNMMCVSLALAPARLTLRPLSSVALQQSIKSAGPVLTAVIEKVIGRHMHSREVMIALVPLTLGPIITEIGSGDVHGNMAGSLVMLLSCVASALKYVLTHKIIIELRKDMGMVSFLFWIEVSVIVVLGPWAIFTDFGALVSPAPRRPLSNPPPQAPACCGPAGPSPRLCCFSQSWRSWAATARTRPTWCSSTTPP